MGEVRELAEKSWAGELGRVNIHPGRALVAFEEIDDGLGFMSAFSNALVVDTDDGLVFVDTSSFFHAKQMYESIRAWSDKRVHTGIYTHGHVDHVFGLLHFHDEAEQKGLPAARIVAHTACPARRQKPTRSMSVSPTCFAIVRPIASCRVAGSNCSASSAACG